VGTAGDVNGDGYSDVIVGACFYDNGEANEGAAAVYHGAADIVIYNHIFLPLAVRNH
jgi:FG-GAP repeat